MTSSIRRVLAVFVFAVSVSYALPGLAADTIKVAHVGPFSDRFASGSGEFLKIFKIPYDRANAGGGAAVRQSAPCLALKRHTS